MGGPVVRKSAVMGVLSLWLDHVGEIYGPGGLLWLRDLLINVNLQHVVYLDRRIDSQSFKLIEATRS